MSIAIEMLVAGGVVALATAMLFGLVLEDLEAERRARKAAEARADAAEKRLADIHAAALARRKAQASKRKDDAQ